MVARVALTHQILVQFEVTAATNLKAHTANIFYSNGISELKRALFILICYRGGIGRHSGHEASSELSSLGQHQSLGPLKSAAERRTGSSPVGSTNALKRAGGWRLLQYINKSHIYSGSSIG